MTSIAIRASLPYRGYTALGTAVGYSAWAGWQMASYLGRGVTEQERRVNSLLGGYPRNHRYKVQRGKLIPSLKLYERIWKVRRTWPENLESFLDIGCCKGFYVCTAAQRPGCRTAVGVDVRETFIKASQSVSDYLGLDNTRFHLATLDQLVRSPTAYGEPFQTVLVIGTYHYLFWGSSSCAHAFFSHESILSQLAALCTDRLIISGRFEMDRLPRNIKTIAAGSAHASRYNTESFLAEAKKHFAVQATGFLGTYPLYVMHKLIKNR